MMKAAMSARPTIRASRPCKVRKRNNSNLRGRAVQEEDEVLPISVIAERLEEEDQRRRCTDCPGRRSLPCLDRLRLCVLLSPAHGPVSDLSSSLMVRSMFFIMRGV